MNLIVEGEGIFISKHQGRIRLVQESQVVEEVPLIQLKQILVHRIDTGVGISSDVVKLCSEEGIALHFLEKNGMVRASLCAAGLTGTVLTRRAQPLAFSSAKGCEFARAFTCGKLANPLHLLRYLMRSRKDEQPQLCQQLHQAVQAIQDVPGERDRRAGDYCKACLPQRQGQDFRRFSGIAWLYSPQSSRPTAIPAQRQAPGPAPLPG
ncbi:CRISPR-associated endonuclease Cas1 [Thermogemmatispora aurantia]|uniref:CRISPR-associated endonuclease Cas1 n=1 Tax=Thermogemmatispora aurantia TaxID=2045279 RepID=UPI00124E462A|nr:CRISPR-associated endonuclease Cas1 [Thermogemmatispora aurantia]